MAYLSPTQMLLDESSGRARMFSSGDAEIFTFYFLVI